MRLACQVGTATHICVLDWEAFWAHFPSRAVVQAHCVRLTSQHPSIYGRIFGRSSFNSDRVSGQSLNSTGPTFCSASCSKQGGGRVYFVVPLKVGRRKGMAWRPLAPRSVLPW